jgi:GDP-L-fucose synthase
MEAAHRLNINRLLFLGSSCIYPKFASQPITEDQLLSGALEVTNEPYAIAKIAGLKLASAYRRQYNRDWISAMPSNIYGPGDNYDLETGHVLPALLRRFHEAKIAGLPEVTLWGDGTPRREFLYSDDLASACLHLLTRYHDEVHVNVGTGSDISISELASVIASITGFKGLVKWDASKPNGTPRKVLETSKITQLGWAPRVSLEEGLKLTYEQMLLELR